MTNRRWRPWAAGALTVSMIAALFGLLSCEVSTPFRGPGYSRGRGVTLVDAGPEVVVALTHATLDGRTRGLFDLSTQKVLDSIVESPGLIGYSVRTRVLGNEVWTMTVWRDEAALDAFAGSAAHREAIRMGMPAVIDAQFHRMMVPASEVPPTWSAVKRVLKEVPTRSYAK